MNYICKAHAADASRPSGVGETLGINEHKSYENRCQTPEMLINVRLLTRRMLIDDMENLTNSAYQTHPDRVVLVRTDGRLAVAVERGPWGFGPGLEATERWLSEFKKTGRQPNCPEPQGIQYVLKYLQVSLPPVIKKRGSRRQNTDRQA